jgi:hypothetical protein
VNRFPTSVTLEQLWGPKFKPDPPENDNGWLILGIFIGAVAGFFACLIGDSGGYFLPVGGLTAFLVWAVGSSKEEK